jgi:hypothetical protein
LPQLSPTLQGPATDPDAIAVIRKGIAEGRDTAVTLVNYKKNGTPFWNRFFVAPLRGMNGTPVNFVGVQCEVKEAVARVLVASQQAMYNKLLAMAQQQQAAAAAAAAAGSAAMTAAGGGAGAAAGAAVGTDSGDGTGAQSSAGGKDRSRAQR